MSSHGGARKGSGRKMANDAPPPRCQPQNPFGAPRQRTGVTLTVQEARRQREIAQASEEQRRVAAERKAAPGAALAAEKTARRDSEELTTEG
jgi:hypothetical protein